MLQLNGLQLTGRGRTCCDGLDRRRFLKAGFLGVAGLSLSDLLRREQAQAAAGRPASGKSVILIWQHGGPSQLDTFDMKPLAPAEVRGPFQPVDTVVPGIRISDQMPHHAQVMDKLTILRGFSHDEGDHFAAAHWILTGYLGPNGSNRTPKNPSMGSVASQIMGPRTTGVPSYVNINDGGFGFHGAAYLGVAHNPFRTGKFSYGNEGVQLAGSGDVSFELTEGLTDLALRNRMGLLERFDRLRRDVDQHGVFDGIDRIEQQAADMLLSGRARDAFDLEQEDAATRERYGDGWGEQALLSRRLIEAGVRFVTLNTGYWDDHGNVDGALRNKLPRHDRALGVLVADLAERGMLEDTLVITAGEFGRTPRINKDAGRDHWPRAQSIALAGGGYAGGRIIGSTNDKAEFPTSGAFGPNDFSTIIYHALGLDPRMTIDNFSGRPIALLPSGQLPDGLV
ncbi:MAG: DUF1501 domain-containing protein [Planctomycetales bacterium]|nr:DUF1501 domain-containing protein [Planctomycetales bacterium]